MLFGMTHGAPDEDTLRFLVATVDKSDHFMFVCVHVTKTPSDFLF